MSRSRIRQVWVAPEFRKWLKLKAAEDDITITDLTRRLMRDDEYFTKKTKGRWI